MADEKSSKPQSASNSDENSIVATGCGMGFLEMPTDMLEYEMERALRKSDRTPSEEGAIHVALGQDEAD